MAHFNRLAGAIDDAVGAHIQAVERRKQNDPLLKGNEYLCRHDTPYRRKRKTKNGAMVFAHRARACAGDKGRLLAQVHVAGPQLAMRAKLGKEGHVDRKAAGLHQIAIDWVGFVPSVPPHRHLNIESERLSQSERACHGDCN